MTEYLVVDVAGRELSESRSLKGAREAVRVHLREDGEQGPLTIMGLDGPMQKGDLDACGNVVFTNVVRRA